MNLKQLETFVRVAELGSFSKAALVLDTAQPALSRQVRALETDLRETLLTRNGRGVRLTDAGQRLFDHATAILQAVERAREEVDALRNEPAGRVVIGLPPSIGHVVTVALVEAFQKRWPKANLAIVEGLSAHIAEWIATGRVDVGLVHNPEPQGAVETTPLFQEDLCLVSRAADPPAELPRAAGGRRGGAARRATEPAPPGPVALASLVGLPLVLPERAHAYRKLLDSQAALAGLKLAVTCEVSSVSSILGLVRAGFGHAVLTRSAVAASGRGDELVVRPLVEPRMTSTLCLVVPAHKKPTPLQRQAATLLRDLLRQFQRSLTH